MDFGLGPATLYDQVVNDFGKSDNRLEIEPTEPTKLRIKRQKTMTN